MTPLIVLEAGACPLPLDNVDTDQLIPARFMKRPRSDGYGQFLLHDLRQDATNPACALDQDRFKGCQIMIAGRNFGCGSSREAAVYALADFGFRCVIASSFGDIFASNAVKNGILPALVSPEHIKILLAHQSVTRGEPIRIDLADQHIRIGNHSIGFSIDPVWKTQLLNGWDDIDMTVSYASDIARFNQSDARARPWARPDRSTAQ
jgi:3-isopropylmalate/(R)-2-methylmalate dehydratase small subunit